MNEEKKYQADAKANQKYLIKEVLLGELVEAAEQWHKDPNLSLKLMTATDERASEGCFKLWFIFGAADTHSVMIFFVKLIKTESFPSIASIMHEAWNYERMIMTFFGLTPIGHPDLRPIMLHENWPDDVFPLRKDFDWQTRPALANGKYEFQTVAGEGIYEIPVGPIHAGIIEPGHFRFSVAGESIVLLEGRLGFVHKGSEKLFEKFSLPEQLKLAEKISGDSSVAHSLAFCQAVEELAGVTAPKRAKYLRVVYAELERLANHCGDIGAMMLDTGFNFGGANGARLRETVMRINERLTGSRFLRGVNIVGGVGKNIGNGEKSKLTADLTKLEADFNEVIAIADQSASLWNRLQGTGKLPADIAQDSGVVGVPARAIGIDRDTRVDFPYAAYDEIVMGKIPTDSYGDAGSRFKVRIKEVEMSFKIIHKALRHLPDGPINMSDWQPSLAKQAIAVAMVEGWRGEIVYFVATDETGKITRVAPRDPSFMNWPLVGKAGFGNVVPDFPLINKSFNLSYSGNDL